MSQLSQLFIDLQNRLAELDSKFMADQVAAETTDPLTFTPDTDRIAAFRLLVHAEIEDYLERKARLSLELMKKDVQTNLYTSKFMPHFFAMSTILAQPIEIKKPFSDAKFIQCILDLINTANELVNDNNGIKEFSFTPLSLFAGIKNDNIDPGLLDKLKSYGASRGDVAHKGINRVQTILAPSAELKAAKDLIYGLEKFFYV